MRKNILLAIAFSLGIWAYLLVLAAPKLSGATNNAMGPEDGITALFSPGGACTDNIIAEIDKATKTIDVQAYTFTSPPLAQALIAASEVRGVHVRVILDKVERRDPGSEGALMHSHHISVYIDDQHAIAHNKVIIIDGKVLMTGSFNFTKASEEKNAENFLILRDRPRLTAAYQVNFEQHLGHSIPMAGDSRFHSAE